MADIRDLSGTASTTGMPAITQAAAGLASQYVVFSVAGEEYCVEILRVQEIIRMMPVTWLPRRPDYIIGVINLRGEIIPVVDLRLKFGLEKRDYSRFTRILIAQFEQRLVGMVVDGVSEVVVFTPEQVEAPPAQTRIRRTDYITGLAKINERVIVRLDLGRVLSEEDKIALQSVEPD